MRLLTLVVVTCAVWLTACPAPCGPGTCFGCCSATGECLPSQPTQCGENGAACAVCQGAEVCASGVCTVLNRGGGAASAGGTASAGGQGGGSAGGVVTAGGMGGGAVVTGGGRAGGTAVGGGAAGGSTMCTLSTGLPGTRCSGLCTDVQRDSSNCGACGRRCGFNETCESGACQPTACRPGMFCSLADGGFGSCCDGTCKSTSSDPSACGGCGLSCPTALCSTGGCVTRCGADAGVCGNGTACVSRSGQRACAITTCTAATENATCSLGGERAGRCCGGACVDLDQSPNCGGCGNVCTGSMQCLGGSCQTSANCANAMVSSTCSVDGGTGSCCDGQCTADVRSSDSNCGGCGRACPSGATCVNGNCTTDAGVTSDCSQTCAPGAACVGSRCVRTDCTGANLGQACGPFVSGSCCGGAACADLQTSTQHCGACGRPCRAGEFCSQGACRAIPTCNLGNDGTTCPFAAGVTGLCCSGACIDSRASASHCGACNASCATGATCSNAQCVQPDGGQATCYAGGTSVCPSGTACQNSKCVSLACPAGSSGGQCAFGQVSNGAVGKCCSGRCVDLTQDQANCGDCARPCTNGLCQANAFGGGGFCLPSAPSTNCFQTCQQGTFCLNGMCQQTGCGNGPPGSACLAGGITGSSVGLCCGFLSQQCVDVRSDVNNCGACGTRCPSGVCIAGVCQSGGATCQRGDVGRFCNPDAGTSSLCCQGSGCIDTQTDNANCGACASPCGSGLTCVGGRCIAPTCTASTSMRPCASGDGGTGTCCGTTCASMATDPLNCGQCNRLCALGEVCSAGSCALAMCSASTLGALCHTTDAGVGSCCGSGCVATRSDPLNCGACNRQCPADAGCVSGMCR